MHIRLNNGFSEDAFEVLARERPVERHGGCFVACLKAEDPGFKVFEVYEIVGRKRSALQDREVDLYLVEPTGVDGRMDQDRIGIPAAQAVDGGLSSMGRAVVGDPKDAMGRAVGLLGHDQVDQLLEHRNTGARTAQAEELGAVHIPGPGRHIGQRAHPFVLMFHTTGLAGLGRCRWCQAAARLNAGFLVGADHKVSGSQRLALPSSVIQIQNASCFVLKIRVPGLDPTAITPGANGIIIEPTPHRRAAG
jgi:hypothetical protein